MSVMRLGYLHARVTDLDAAKKHYVDTLGMQIVAEESPEPDPDPRIPQAVKALTAKPRRLFLKAWDEWDHHSVVLEEGGVGLVKLGYKVAREDDLVDYEKRVQAFGCTTERMSYHDNPAVGEGIRVHIPSGHIMELYHEIEFTDTAVGLINPALFPRHLTGIGVPRLDHALLKAEDIPLSERFFKEAMDFKPAERLVSDLSDDAELLGTWMFCQHKTHDIAFVAGENGKLHHWAYKLESWDKIKHAGAILSMDDVEVGFGPDVHGLSRGDTIYFFDPAGNRNEVFAGGYETYPDFPTITWTADHTNPAVSYIGREVRDNHFTVDT
jgi:catechol 2,3-dioxygenase